MPFTTSLGILCVVKVRLSVNAALSVKVLGNALLNNDKILWFVFGSSHPSLKVLS